MGICVLPQGLAACESLASHILSLGPLEHMLEMLWCSTSVPLVQASLRNKQLSQPQLWDSLERIAWIQRHNCLSIKRTILLINPQVHFEIKIFIYICQRHRHDVMSKTQCLSGVFLMASSSVAHLHLPSHYHKGTPKALLIGCNFHNSRGSRGWVALLKCDHQTAKLKNLPVLVYRCVKRIEPHLAEVKHLLL